MTKKRKTTVLITRPREAALAVERILEPLGYRTLVEPLLTIEPIDQITVIPKTIQALALTSAHAVPALSDVAKDLPVFVVGSATASAARAAGFGRLHVSDGDGAALADLIKERCSPKDGGILHVSGDVIREEMRQHLEEAGFDLQRQIVYRAAASMGFSEPTVSAWRLKEITAVLLYSPRTASILVDLLRSHALIHHVDRTSAICLSEATATPCRVLAWEKICVATRPHQDALIRALEGSTRLC